MIDTGPLGEGEYGLIMPFVVCQSKGGNLDDHAFVAGVQFGQLYQQLRGGGYVEPVYVTPDIVRQLDLAAMHCGYRMATDSWDEHNTLVQFEKITEQGES